MTRQAELQKINAVRVNDLRCPLLPRTSRAPTRAAPSSHSARFARRLLRASDIARAAMPLAVVGDYELTRKIGEGGYGRIFLGRKVNGLDEPEVVLKQVKLPSKKTEREMCLREVSIMKGVHHPCILECVESSSTATTCTSSCRTAPEATSRLCWRGRARAPASRVHRPRLVRQILLGVEHLHSHDTLHRDLKANVFLRRDEREPASSRRRPGTVPRRNTASRSGTSASRGRSSSIRWPRERSLERPYSCPRRCSTRCRTGTRRTCGLWGACCTR